MCECAHFLNKMNDIEQLNSLFYCLYCTSIPLHSQSWPGLPRGVEFNPSDSDLLWHLAAEVGNALAERHPFINESIKFVDDVREFICTHPQHIPGI